MTLTRIQQALLERARQEGQPLDPWDADGAAVLLRAEVLVRGGAAGGRALARARQELAASRSPWNGARRWCPVCGAWKTFFVRAGVTYLKCAHRYDPAAQPAARGESVHAGRGGGRMDATRRLIPSTSETWAVLVGSQRGST